MAMVSSRTAPIPSETDTELVISRAIRAPRSRVFAAWSDCEHLMRWWGPRSSAGRDFTTPSCSVEFRVGGSFHICIRSPEGIDYWQRGTYRELVVPERITFTFAWESDQGSSEHEMIVAVRFSEQDDQTLVTFHHAGFLSAKERDEHRGGWRECLDRLADYLENR
jgi:uncharacterized protein YndB with AHSA1/START domain